MTRWGHSLSLGGDPKGGVVPFTNSPDTSTTEIELIWPGLRETKVLYKEEILSWNSNGRLPYSVLAKLFRSSNNFNPTFKKPGSRNKKRLLNWVVSKLFIVLYYI